MKHHFSVGSLFMTVNSNRRKKIMISRLFLGTIIVFTLSLGFACRSKTVVIKNCQTKIQNESSSKSSTDKIDGVMYHLPKTVVQAAIPVKRVTKLRGDYWKFAPCFFSKENWRILFLKTAKLFLSIRRPSRQEAFQISETYVIKRKAENI